MQHYVRDDTGYLTWLTRNPNGFVINTYATPSRAYLKLHQAICPSISRLQLGARTFTDGEYSKLCGSRAELERHARSLGGTAQPCPLCLLTRREASTLRGYESGSFTGYAAGLRCDLPVFTAPFFSCITASHANALLSEAARRIRRVP
jgi:hypothetical protein